MRAVILPLLLAAALLAVPAALADDERGGDHRAAGEAKATEARANHTAEHDDDNETDDDANESHGGRSADARHDATSFQENRSAILDRVLDQIHALRASWHENATKIREGCHAADIDRENATKDDRTAHAHCVRDGYREWRAAHTAEIKEIREELRARLETRRGDHGEDD